MNVDVVVLSCDKYSEYWDYFFKLKNKYWKDCPYKTYLVSETKKRPRTKMINVDSPIWTKRFRTALEQLKSDYVIVLLEDYFIRSKVLQDRIEQCLEYMKSDFDPIVWNFEHNYRKSSGLGMPSGWLNQYNHQVYLNSCQPSLWNRKRLIQRLQKDQNAWEWELTIVDSPYDHYIDNHNTYTIDVGYRYGQEFGVKQGKLTDEAREFLTKEGLI